MIPDFKANVARSGAHEITISLQLDDLPGPVRNAVMRAVRDDEAARQITEAIIGQVSEPVSHDGDPGGGRGFTAEPCLIRIARLQAIEVRAVKLVEFGHDGRWVYA